MKCKIIRRYGILDGGSYLLIRHVPKKHIVLLTIVLLSFFTFWSFASWAQQKSQNERARDDEQSAIQDPDSTTDSTSGILPSDATNQEYIITATDLLLEISRDYATIRDIQSDLTIIQDSQESKAKFYLKKPDFLRIQYESPARQVIVSDGELYQIYIPQQNVVLSQKKNTQASAGATADLGDTGTIGNILNEEGLLQLRRNYFSSFVDTPTYKRVEGILQPVIGIKLTWKYSTQSFREIVLYVGRDNIIYRVEGLTYNSSSVTFSFDNIKINEGIPSTIFVYDPPPSASVIENFLQE